MAPPPVAEPFVYLNAGKQTPPVRSECLEKKTRNVSSPMWLPLPQAPAWTFPNQDNTQHDVPILFFAGENC